ncbi:nhl-1 [Cordylochernes scorpioides]|uniref:Nhl-1 n=1 Tax=Cordylochernes scorpioides TaxID=51811 RepID=A0ABY6JY07_9ARAC|nr:nhl-1 [Cordylochernes scorpioides]
MTTAWTQMDALLTCELCGEHFRNPKQLPCQHTFCMEPCLERLVDRGQLKCPRCGTDFRVPFQGLSAFPNNVTLVRFLELRQSVSGEDPAPPASLLQCSVCRDRGPVQRCAHCGRKLCKECQKAHSQIVRREFNLVATEAKQAVTDLKDIYETTKKNTEKLQENYKAVKAEVEELANNFTNDILKTEQKMKYELDLYETMELRNMNTFQKSLEIEISNINSNCDLIDKYMNENVSWTDKELVEYKDMFQRTLEFLRYLDIDPSSDYARRVRFQPHVDTEAMHRTLQDWGEVGVQSPSPEPLIPRCQSDHRLAVPMSDDIMDDDDEDFPTAPSSVRRFEAPQTRKVTVTEDSTRGPLSGVSKLEDSPKVMERLHETEVRQKVEAEKVAREPPPAPTFAPPPPPTRVTRQVSEDDIDKQKRQNKAAAAEASEPAPRPRPAWRPPEPEPVVPKEKPPEVPSSTRPRSWRTETAEPAAPKDKPPVAPRATAQVVNKVPRLKPPEPEEDPAPSRRVTYLTRTGSLERPDPPADGYRPTHSFSSRFLDKIRARREEEKEETPSASSASSAESDEEETTTTRTRDDISPAVNALLARSAQARRDSARSHSLLEASRRPISRYARHSEREKSPERPDRRSRFRTAAMSRSKSSHELQPAEESQDEERPLSPYRSRYGRQENGNEDSWSQYLRNKYARTRREQSDTENSSDEEQPARNPRRTYTQKGKLTLKFGTRGSEPGCFTWPRGVTSGPDNTIAVADSSNHRIQVRPVVQGW